MRNLNADPFGPNQIPGLWLLRLDGPTHRVVDKSGVDLFSNLIESLPFFYGGSILKYAVLDCMPLNVSLIIVVNNESHTLV